MTGLIIVMFGRNESSLFIQILFGQLETWWYLDLSVVWLVHSGKICQVLSVASCSAISVIDR